MDSKIHVDFFDQNSGPLSFSYFVESSPDGSGVKYEDMTIYIYEEVTLYAVKRDSSGRYMENIAVSWSLIGGTGALSIVGDGLAAEFSSADVGQAQVRMLDDGELVRVVDIDVTLPPSSELEVETLALSDITYDSFEASINYDGDYEENSTNTLSYCNRSAQPACDPVNDGTSVAMDRGASSLTASISGLTPNADYAVRYVAVDPDGVIGSDTQNEVISLLDEPLTLTNLSITNTTKSGMSISVDYSGDFANNGSATFFYCNETLDSSCDPEDAMSGGLSMAMTKTATNFSATLSGLSGPNFNEADRVKVRIVAEDPDGTVDSPMNSAAYLADLTLDVAWSYFIGATRDSFNVKVNFTEDNTNGSVKLYYCNQTLNSSCDPLVNDQFDMTRNAGNFSGNVTGVTTGYSEGDLVKIRFVGTDPDGVRHSGSMYETIRLTGLGLELDDVQIGRITKDSLHVSVNRSGGDNNNNATADFYYCNQTQLGAGCDPESAGIRLSLSKSDSYIKGDLTNLLSTNNSGDLLKTRLKISDPEGVYFDGVVVSPAIHNQIVKLPDPRDIYRSVEVAQTGILADFSVAGALSLSSGTAKFASSLPNDIGVGDAIIYDSNGAGSTSPDSVAFIHERLSASEYIVRDVSGDIPSIDFSNDEDWQIYRAYTSLNAALTGDENLSISASLRDFDTWTGGYDISAQTGADLNWNIALYASSTTDQTAINILSPWKTDWANKLRLFTPTQSSEVGSDQRHSGAWDSDLYTFESLSHNSFRAIGVNSVIVEGLQIHHTGSDDDATVVTFGSAENFIFKNNLVRSSSTGTNLKAFRVVWAVGGAAANNVFFGFSTQNSTGIYSDAEGNGARIAFYSNTFYNVYQAVRRTGNNTYRSSSLKNNLALNCIDVCYSNSSGINPIHNASSDDSANSINNNAGTSIANVGSATLHLEDPIGMDFRLRSSSSLVGAGIDLSDDPDDIFDFDFDFIDSTRPAGGWSVGASQ